MRTETITRNLYTFDELSNESKETALEKLWDLNVFHEWWDFIYDEAERVGLKITEFDEHSLKSEFIALPTEIATKILSDHGDKCETYKTSAKFLKERADLVHKASQDDDGEYTDPYSLDQDLDELEDSFHHDINEDYRIIIRNTYDELTSTEAIIESIKANEYEFTAAGELA